MESLFIFIFSSVGAVLGWKKTFKAFKEKQSRSMTYFLSFVVASFVFVVSLVSLINQNEDKTISINYIALIILIIVYFVVFFQKSKQDKDHSSNETIKSFTSNKEYEINLLDQTCTCQDFIDRRIEYDENTPQRFCKHLLSQLDNTDLPAFLKPYKDTVDYCISSGRGMPIFAETIEYKNHIIVVENGSEWLNIHTKDGTRHGYKPFGNKWAYSDIPKGFEDFKNDDILIELVRKYPQLEGID